MSSPSTFVVTTRSHLRGRRHVPLMLAATRRIMREMPTMPGAATTVSIIATPREFWTVSVWTSLHQMQEFMRGGSHGAFMWEVSEWLDSFWLMRWRPTQHEVGTWNGLTLAPERHTVEHTGLPAHVRDEVLASFPHLRAAFGPDGAPTYESSPEARRQRELVAGSAGVLVRLPATLSSTTRGRRQLERLARDLADHDDDLMRMVTGRAQGVGSGVFLLGVWRSRSGSGRLLDSRWAEQARREWGEDFWACELLPENEFGHWDGLRLRDSGALGALGTPMVLPQATER